MRLRLESSASTIRYQSHVTSVAMLSLSSTVVHSYHFIANSTSHLLSLRQFFAVPVISRIDSVGVGGWEGVE